MKCAAKASLISASAGTAAPNSTPLMPQTPGKSALQTSSASAAATSRGAAGSRGAITAEFAHRFAAAASAFVWIALRCLTHLVPSGFVLCAARRPPFRRESSLLLLSLLDREED